MATSGTESIEFGRIIWIRSLPEHEIGLSKRATDDLSDAFAANNAPNMEVYDVDTRSELERILAKIHEACEHGLRPLLIFDAHGDAGNGLKLSQEEEHFSWEDLMDYLRAINTTSEGNLVCLLGCCFGFHAYKEVQITEPAPAYMFASPVSELSQGDLIDGLKGFCLELVETQDIQSAFKKHLAKIMSSMNCQEVFAHAFILYLRDFGSAKKRQERAENLLTKISDELDGKVDLKKMRKYLKKGLVPTHDHYRECAQKFLIRRPPVSKFKTIRDIAKSKSKK